MKCKSCGNKLSLSWFIFSFHWTKYVCPNCGTLYEWTKKRKILGGIIGGLSGLASPLIILYLRQLTSIESIYYRLILGIFLFAIVIMILMFIQLSISGQFSTSEKQPFLKN